jgi:hypothetical protein
LTTTSINVNLDVSAANAAGGQVGLNMSFSNNGVDWSSWQPYADSTLWQLTNGDGLKTVYGRFKDSAGNLSAIVSDTITLDTSVQSEYGVTINDGALYTNQVTVQLKISAKPRTVAMQISNDGGFYGLAWEPYTSHKTWQITHYGDYAIPRIVYVRYRDTTDNVSATYQDDIILDMERPHECDQSLWMLVITLPGAAPAFRLARAPGRMRHTAGDVDAADETANTPPNRR